MASNRQLEEMQEEHRQLQQELTRLSAHRQQLRIATSEEHSQVTTRSVSSGVQESEPESPSPSEGATATAVVEEENKEEADYLQQKLSELANLKAQFKRVQEMTDSTKLIEQHLSSMESKSSTVVQSRKVKSIQSSSSTTSSSSTSSSRSQMSSETATSEEAATSGERAAPDNAELLNAMINMVTDFTSDLRGQEESLRAERLRIKTLKEEIIQRKESK